MIPREIRHQQYKKIHDDANALDMGTGKHEHLKKACRDLCMCDVFYLLTHVMNRWDLDTDWLYARCMEVQENPDGHLDLWAREHYKSTIITYALTIQDILKNPEITICIFSHTKPIAKAFLRQIKYELETNDKLKYLFPEILWPEPKKNCMAAGVQWSEDKGITVIRSSNPKESTLEASGLVDGQPTSRHYSLLVYDDIVTLESVSSPEMMLKTTNALALSYNLGAHGGHRRFIGTRYHYNDTYATLIDRGTVTQRIYPATDNGQMDGKPVFLTRKVLDDKRRDMGPYIFACQMLQNPKADSAMGFDEEWLKTYIRTPIEAGAPCNVYILVDPANEKRKMNDYTSIWVIGTGADNNYYILDGVRDRLNLTERTNTLFRLHRKWQPICVGYEKYSMQSDIQHIEFVQGLKSYYFPIIPLGGQIPKNDRIRRLIPLFEQGRMWMPKYLPFVDHEGKQVDLIKTFKDEEYKAFPVSSHDDMLDCMARIEEEDMKITFPYVGGRTGKPNVLRSLR